MRGGSELALCWLAEASCSAPAASDRTGDRAGLGSRASSLLQGLVRVLAPPARFPSRTLTGVWQPGARYLKYWWRSRVFWREWQASVEILHLRMAELHFIFWFLSCFLNKPGLAASSNAWLAVLQPAAIWSNVLQQNIDFSVSIFIGLGCFLFHSSPRIWLACCGHYIPESTWSRLSQS